MLFQADVATEKFLNANIVMAFLTVFFFLLFPRFLDDND